MVALKFVMCGTDKTGCGSLCLVLESKCGDNIIWTPFMSHYLSILYGKMPISHSQELYILRKAIPFILHHVWEA